MKLIMAITILAAVSPLAISNYMDGNSLKRICTSDVSRETIQCYGYVAGAIDQLNLMVDVGDGVPFHCPPEQMALGQAKSVVEKYLKDHPEELHKPASSIVIFAMSKSFPCQ